MIRPYLFIMVFAIVSCGGSEEEETTDSTDTTDEITDEVIEDVVDIIENTTVLEPGTVGMFIIGTPVPELPEDLSSRIGAVELTGEGMTYEVPLNTIYNHFEDMLDLQMEDNNSQEHEDLWITEIMVHSSYYETSKGIAVGSTIQEFAETYPDCELRYTHVGERYVVETPELDGIQFLLDYHDCINTPTTKSGHKSLEIGDFKDGAKIQQIRVF